MTSLPPHQDGPDPAPRDKYGALRKSIEVVGELLITFGVLFALFAAYQLWWTNVISARQTDQARQDFINQQTKVDEKRPAYNATFALLYIPRLRDKVWGLPIVQGTNDYALARGAGHYKDTALPGQLGNFAIAAHRATHGEPFADFDRLRDGDMVYVRTHSYWYSYKLVRDQIVTPESTWVIRPKPFAAGVLSDRIITLTTCNPRWASYERWAYWGDLTKAAPAADGAPINLEGQK